MRNKIFLFPSLIISNYSWKWLMLVLLSPKNNSYRTRNISAFIQQIIKTLHLRYLHLLKQFFSIHYWHKIFLCYELQTTNQIYSYLYNLASTQVFNSHIVVLNLYFKTGATQMTLIFNSPRRLIQPGSCTKH